MFLISIFITIINLIKFTFSIYLVKKCENYSFTITNIYEKNYFIYINNTNSSTLSISLTNNDFLTTHPENLCWTNYSSMKDLKIQEIEFQSKKVDILIVSDLSIYYNDLFMEYKRIDNDDGRVSINFYFNNISLLNTYYFYHNETDPYNCGKNYIITLHFNDSLYQNKIIGFLECVYNNFQLNFKIEICPKYCNENCIYNDKICYSNKYIDIIIEDIQHEWFELNKHVQERIIDNTNNNYVANQIQNDNLDEACTTYYPYLNCFCYKVLNIKYNPIDYFLLFKNENDIEQSILLKNHNKEILNYKIYCQNYTIQVEPIQIIDKKYELNFSNFLVTNNGNDLLNNSLNYTSLIGRIEFYNRTEYTQNLKYPLIDKLYFLRNGIYYSQSINFNITYGGLPPPIPLNQILILNIYPFYCNENVNLLNKECKTSYSINEIQKELEKINIDLHEHLNEKIINDNYYSIEIFNSTGITTQSSLYNPLEQCTTIYNKIDNTILDLIFIKYEEIGKETYFEIYKNDIFNHTKLSTNFCTNHTIINEYYKIINTSVLEINLNDLITPKLIDDNIYDTFQLILISNSGNYFGKLFEENLNGEINELQIILNNPIITNSRKYLYYPVNKYYEISFSFEIIHYDNIRNNMIGSIKIGIFPEFCEPNLSSLEEKKCITNYEEEYIKKYILSDYHNEKIYISQNIFGPSYSLYIYEEDNYNIITCDAIFKKFYNFNNNDKYYVIKSERNSNEILIEWYHQKIIPYEKINEKLCTEGYFYKIEKIINYNFKTNITELIKSILPKNYLNNYFEIKIYTEEEYPNIRRLEISSEQLIIEYKPDKYKYYNEKFYFEIEKDGVFLNIKGELNFIVYPIYCENYYFLNNYYNCFSNNTLEEIINFINFDDINNIKEHNNEIIYNEDYYFQIQKINLNERLISDKINFDTCESQIREIYSLKQDENIYLEIIENKKLKQFSFKIFNSYGVEYNNSLCSSIILKNSLFNYPFYQKLKFLDINLFDFNSSFYNDLCFDFSLDGYDLTLIDRKNLMIKENLCYKNCKFKYFNKENNLIDCECKINSNNQIFDLNTVIIRKENNKNNFINYKFIKCSNFVFNLRIIKKNIGFWLFSIIIIIQITIIFYYLFYGQNYFNLLIETLDSDFTQNIILYNKNKNITKRNKENDITLTSSRVKIEIDKKQVYDTQKEIKKKNTNIYISDIDYLIYSNALKNDSRNFLLMYSSLIKEKNLLIKCFISNSIFELKSINLFIFLLYISFIFSLNVLFYDENIISEKYQNGEISLNSNLIKIVFSSLFNFIITTIIFKLCDYTKTLNYIIYEFLGSKYFIEVMKRKLICLKIKLYLFLFLTLLFNFWLLYFVSAFCGLYQNTQLSWFIGGTINLLLLIIFSLIYCFINSSMRFISIHHKIEWLYNLSTYFREIF